MTGKWLPPHPASLDPNRSAGYLGYYTRNYLDPVFDLMDLDGCWPAVWLYRRAETNQMRYFEEKPHGQELHPSQHRILRHLSRLPNTACFVIWDAEQLADDPPTFPLSVTRLGPTQAQDKHQVFVSSEKFGQWLLNGLAPVQRLLEMPFDRPAYVPDHVDWDAIDVALTRLAVALGPEVDL